MIDRKGVYQTSFLASSVIFEDSNETPIVFCSNDNIQWPDTTKESDILMADEVSETEFELALAGDQSQTRNMEHDNVLDKFF